MKSIDTVAIGACYVDINAEDYPFDQNGIPAEVELVGGGYELAPGGSAVNFCCLLQRLGQRTAFIGLTGDDPIADILGGLLREHGVQPFLTRRPGLYTNISFNLTGPQESHIMLVAGTANAALSPDLVLPKLRRVVHQARTLYLGGCFKLKTFQQAFSDVAELAKQHGAVLVVDHGRIPQSTNEDMLQAVRDLVLSADYYMPSHQEFVQLWGVASIEEGLRLLKKRSPQLTIVVKDGSRGAWFLEEQSLGHVKAEQIAKPSNLSGAGDSFNAGLITAVQAGHRLSEAVAYANKVAAAKISGRDVPALYI